MHRSVGSASALRLTHSIWCSGTLPSSRVRAVSWLQLASSTGIRWLDRCSSRMLGSQARAARLSEP